MKILFSFWTFSVTLSYIFRFPAGLVCFHSGLSQSLCFQDYWKVESTSIIYRVYRIAVLQLTWLRESEYAQKNSLKSSIKCASTASGFISQESRKRWKGMRGAFYWLLSGKIILRVTFAKNVICLGYSRDSMKSSGRNSSLIDFFSIWNDIVQNQNYISSTNITLDGYGFMCLIMLQVTFERCTGKKVEIGKKRDFYFSMNCSCNNKEGK